jgi:hypothetical protein
MILKYIRIILSIAIKPKFYKIYFRLKPSSILDIGIANDSYRECKSIFPQAEYHGLDLFHDYIKMNDADKYYCRNLEDLDALRGLKENYDLIIANHVLEHIERGEDVFKELCCLLSDCGLLYVEFPSIRTAYKEKRWGSYHFHDDHTHRSFYNLESLANIAIDNGCKIVSCGPVSTFIKDVFAIPRALLGVFLGKDWGPYLLHFQRKVDHIMVVRNLL